MNNDLISRKWLTDAIRNRRTYLSYEDAKDVIDLIDNAPAVNPCDNCDLYFKAMTKAAELDNMPMISKKHKGCISCVHCKAIRNHYFCGNTRLTEKQVFNSKGYCSIFKSKNEKGGAEWTKD